MNKQERASLIGKLKPQTWYTFCQLEASYPEEAKVSKNDLMHRLNLGSLQTLNKYLTIFESYGMIRQIPGGFIIAQINSELSRINEEPVEREFKTSKDIIKFWCSIYEEQFDRPYDISNWVAAQSQVKKLLRYPDEEIKATLQAIVSLYERMWAKPSYPRPTLGAVCSWLYQQAQPYAVSATETHSIGDPEDNNLLEEMEAKGWL